MPRSSKLTASLGAIKGKLAGGRARSAVRDPRITARVILGILLAANIVAALFAFRPWEDSPEQLEIKLTDLKKQQLQRKMQIDRLMVLTAKSEKARKEGEQFLSKYFLSRRTASSTLVNELITMSKASGIKPKEHSFAFEPIEGSDDLSMMTITANYEGTYADLIQYANRLDRSQRFFIVESMTAAPQQGGQGVLNINIKVNVFVREEGPQLPGARTALAQNTAPEPDSPAPAEQPAGTDAEPAPATPVAVGGVATGAVATGAAPAQTPAAGQPQSRASQAQPAPPRSARPAFSPPQSMPMQVMPQQAPAPKSVPQSGAGAVK
jgi:Tfp pilus assembly protein PilO